MTNCYESNLRSNIFYTDRLGIICLDQQFLEEKYPISTDGGWKISKSKKLLKKSSWQAFPDPNAISWKYIYIFLLK